MKSLLHLILSQTFGAALEWSRRSRDSLDHLIEIYRRHTLLRECLFPRIHDFGDAVNMFRRERNGSILSDAIKPNQGMVQRLDDDDDAAAWCGFPN